MIDMRTAIAPRMETFEDAVRVLSRAAKISLEEARSRLHETRMAGASTPGLVPERWKQLFQSQKK